MIRTGRQPADAAPPLVVVMGVSGSGKTTIGELLADRLGLPYAEADGFHPAENIAKMSAGRPLDDADRRPWLDAIAVWLTQRSGKGGVVSCSALKRSYRDRLAQAVPEVFFLHLTGSYELIEHRLARRTGHFMPTGLLHSQFADLEPLDADERGATVPVDGGPEEIVDRALARIADDTPDFPDIPH
ncbi:gluconokinase [Streptomyces sp. KR80]|uniref:gluconokinase n=1 Tax=Streptomyces sp. KR80 TaxID=3457426 RepID=UPI003FD640E4